LLCSSSRFIIVDGSNSLTKLALTGDFVLVAGFVGRWFAATRMVALQPGGLAILFWLT
jgi:hypothetical protein